MKLSLKYLIAIAGFAIASSCYKYSVEPEYAVLKGSFVDKFTNTTLDVGSITLSPAKSVNGSLNIDTSGYFTNVKILPGDYTIYGSIKAAFTSDSAKVSLSAGSTNEVKLVIEPWISVQQRLVSVQDTTVTVSYSINGNKGKVPAFHAIAWSTSPKPTANTYPGGNRNMYTPEAGANNGTFTYTITGLKWNTTYFIVTGARIDDAVVNPTKDFNYAKQIIIRTPERK
ncbi:MAG: hypothetical protein J0H29_16950 [Sphingobacteriales bacterium]|nr:hypothetical protein [Sphingobacteriales bacterium]OJY86171.1 MAG: hypothetical protein BGP14_16985 [Sphingobacteriales bacterium 44-15]